MQPKTAAKYQPADKFLGQIGGTADKRNSAVEYPRIAFGQGMAQSVDRADRRSDQDIAPVKQHHRDHRAGIAQAHINKVIHKTVFTARNSEDLVKQPIDRVMVPPLIIAANGFLAGRSPADVKTGALPAAPELKLQPATDDSGTEPVLPTRPVKQINTHKNRQHANRLYTAVAQDFICLQTSAIPATQESAN